MSGPPDWYDHVNAAVRKMGLEMRYFTDFQDRQDVVDAYLQTDIQFQWCYGMPEKLEYTKNPMRVINGLSFGIPMVSSPAPAYVAECAGSFVQAESIDLAMEAIDQLRRLEDCYGWCGQYGPALAEPYHLTHVAESFRRLSDG
jgi:hypothetical protein